MNSLSLKKGNVKQDLQEMSNNHIKYAQADFYEICGDDKPFDGNIADHFRTGIRGDLPWVNKVVAYSNRITPRWGIGAHTFASIPMSPFDATSFIIAHYKYALGLDRVINRHKFLTLSQDNLINGWAEHVKDFKWTKDYYNKIHEHAVKVF